MQILLAFIIGFLKDESVKRLILKGMAILVKRVTNKLSDEDYADLERILMKL